MSSKGLLLLIAFAFVLASAQQTQQLRYTVITDIDGQLTYYFNNTFAATNAMVFRDGLSLLRPDANTIFQDYSKKGYYIQYYAARPEGGKILGKTMREFTEGWLIANGFPFGPGVGSLLLSTLQDVSNDPNEAGAQMGSYWQANAYRILCKMFDDLAKENKRVLYAYGDAGFASDAFIECGKLPPEQIVLHIGIPNAYAAGHRGTLIHSAETYTDWRATYVAAAPYTSNITAQPSPTPKPAQEPEDEHHGSGLLVVSIILAVVAGILAIAVGFLLWQKYNAHNEEAQTLLPTRSYA